MKNDVTARKEVAVAAMSKAFSEADVTGHLYARDIATGADIGLNGDTLVSTASVFKIPVLVELCKQAAEGKLQLADRVTITPENTPTLGPTGLSVMLDTVEISLRDLAYWMMSVSDNRATDIICDIVGLDQVDATMRDFGLTRTAIPYTCQAMFQQIALKAGVPFSAITGNEAPVDAFVSAMSTTALDTETTNRTTPREIVELLTQIWCDEVIDPAAAAEVRRVMRLQVWPHRLKSGFPDDAVSVPGKTGTMVYVRNEAGVVEYPDGGRYAVGVFLTDEKTNVKNPVADRVIGTAGRIAVDYLRALK